MREENIKVKVTIPIPFGKPDKNGVMYTEEAVSNAVNNLHKNLPIIYEMDEDKWNWWIERFKQDGCALFTDEEK